LDKPSGLVLYRGRLAKAGGLRLRYAYDGWREPIREAPFDLNDDRTPQAEVEGVDGHLTLDCAVTDGQSWDNNHGADYPFEPRGSTELLVALHLPVALWLVVGVVYLGADWRPVERRMNFVRFTGEWFIYYVLIALGGGVLIALTVATFEALGIDTADFVEYWMLPCGAAGAVVVAAWLVEAKQSVIENMAPVLTRVFTPLFAAMFLASVIGLLLSGDGVRVNRDSLILFDLLLIAVVGLLLYAISARSPEAPATAMDAVQLILILSAFLLDIFALTAILSRISEFGFTPNRTVGLGWNLILLANLIWSARLSIGMLRGQEPFATLERWQTAYVNVYGLWLGVVVVVFPPLFAFA
jgi:hypothetical protein